MNKYKRLIIAGVALFLTGCSSDATVVTKNIKKDTEQFKVIRRVIFMNSITGEYLFEANGNCSVETNNLSIRNKWRYYEIIF